MKTFWHWVIISILMVFASICFVLAFPELETKRLIALFFGVECVALFINLIEKDFNKN